MISFKDFLSEKVVTKWTTAPLDVREGIELLNAHCKKGLEAVDAGSLLFRGDKKASRKIFTVDPSTGERTSLDSSNIYQIMMDSSPSLSDVPSRSKSLICTTNIDEAASYGKAFVVVPFDGVNIAESSSDDFWRNSYIDVDGIAEDITIEDLDDRILDIFVNSFDVTYGSKTKFTDIKKLDKIISSDVDAFVEGWQEGLGSDISGIANKHPNDLLSALATKLMTKNTLGIRMRKYGDRLANDTECWFSGPCVMVAIPLFYNIMLAMEEQGTKVPAELLDNLKRYSQPRPKNKKWPLFGAEKKQK